MDEFHDELHKEIKDKKLVKANNKKNFKACLLILAGIYVVLGAHYAWPSEHIKTDKHAAYSIECPECGAQLHTNYRPNYCTVCGAKLR